MKIHQMRVGPIGTNCYILMDEAEKKIAIIDPGEDAPAIMDAVKQMGGKVCYLLHTHGHYDHTTAAPALADAYPDAAVYIHKADQDGTGSTLFPLSSKIKTLSNYDEGDILPLGSLSIHVMHTPGHSLGGVCLLVEDVIFSGDTLFAGTCGRCDLKGGDLDTILKSLARLGRLDGDYIVRPGHEGMTTLSRERATNPYMRQGMAQE